MPRLPEPRRMSHPANSAEEVIRRREAFEELIRTDGWQLFVSHVLYEWEGRGYQTRMGTALATKDLIEPQAVHKAAMEIVRLLQWPVDQVRELKGSE